MGRTEGRNDPPICSNQKLIGILTENGTISMTRYTHGEQPISLFRIQKGLSGLLQRNGLVHCRTDFSHNGMSYKLTRYLQRDSDDMYSLSNNVYCVYEDHHGRIWAATFAGQVSTIFPGEKDGKTVFINHRNNLKDIRLMSVTKLVLSLRIITDALGGTTTGAVAFDENFKNRKIYSSITSPVCRTIRKFK